MPTKPVEYSQFGSDNGQIVIYFHGAPGSTEECAIFDSYAKDQGLTIICLERFSIASEISGETYYQFLAREISALADGKSVDFIGFSIGAFIALQTSRYMTDGVRSLHLISAAAPLEAGDFINAMAGKQVFKLAKAFPGLFVFLSYWQSLLALFFAKTLFNLLFASAAGADKALVNDREFQASNTKVLRSCFICHIQGYVRDIKAYVQPWETTLSDISVNTHIWHSAEDNWSPTPMAGYLKSAIPNCASIEIMAGLSHYSCLYAAMPKICRQLHKA